MNIIKNLKISNYLFHQKKEYLLIKVIFKKLQAGSKNLLKYNLSIISSIPKNILIFLKSRLQQ